MAADSYRKRFNFWLDVEKPKEKELTSVIAKLKKDYKYTGAVRDGLRLIWDLSQGRVDVLLELFPFVKDAVAGRFGLVMAGEEQSSVLGQLQRLEHLMMSGVVVSVAEGNVVSSSNMSGGYGNAQTLSVQSFAPPSFEDGDEDEDLLIEVFDDENAAPVSSSGADPAERLLQGLRSFGTVRPDFDD